MNFAQETTMKNQDTETTRATNDETVTCDGCFEAVSESEASFCRECGEDFVFCAKCVGHDIPPFMAGHPIELD
jgi:rRNA maturation endonuclease Nob1